MQGDEGRWVQGAAKWGCKEEEGKAVERVAAWGLGEEWNGSMKNANGFIALISTL